MEINQLLKASKRVILDCAQKNGAIVAANSKSKSYPKDAKNYFFVWPRDCMYTCIAARHLGVDTIQLPYFDWLMKLSDWKKTGLFSKNYTVDGKKYEDALQIDQSGSVLITIWDFCKDYELPKKYNNLVIATANSICKLWKKTYFDAVTEDLWEEHHAFPDEKENFSYSLGMCYRGLLCANELFPNKKWEKTAFEMKQVLLDVSFERFRRSIGRLADDRVDASLLGLGWPAEIVSYDSPILIGTVHEIEHTLTVGEGISRYLCDNYDGWMYKDKGGKLFDRKKKAGYWPLLNFWMAIYYAKSKNQRKALMYFHKALADLKRDGEIPEQIFDNDIQISVKPLCWSHAMFVIAAKELKEF